MSEEVIDTIIIGGGISGLYAGYLLSQHNDSFMILEARNRLGGRILCSEYKGYSFDLGPSWYWPSMNPKIVYLMKKFNLGGYPQYDMGNGRFQHPNGFVQTVRGYDMNPPCFRIHGGMESLINKLSENISKKAVKLNHPVCEIKKDSNHALLFVGKIGEQPLAMFRAKKIILALPPRLAAASILFTPDLSHNLTQAMLGLGTWMAGQAKFCALYEKPYWREMGLSGQAFSQVEPLGEIHDATNKSDAPYGLTGFLNVHPAQRTDEEMLLKEILSQLAMIYGKSAKEPVSFSYQDWAKEPFTATEFDQHPMYEHPLYQPPLGKADFWEGMVHFAGTETDDQHGGYLEGALASAERAVAYNAA